jgi:dTDP-4-amino-4,6-dideoxygalactose transaminase
MAGRIAFHVPTLTGLERGHLADLLGDPHGLASDGKYSKACAELLGRELGFERVFFTPSCTAALELAAMLTVGPGDEVICPSFTFVTSVSSFTNLGAVPVYCDVTPDTLNIDVNEIERLITPRTKVIVAVHYAGIGCEMDEIRRLAAARGIVVVEDAAHALSGRYRGRPLGSVADLACFSFHSTKNYHCGEGGALVINDERFVAAAEIHREKGTNRRAFIERRVEKYTWVDRGSSYAPTELAMAFLLGQLERLTPIKSRRRALFERYVAGLTPLQRAGQLRLPGVPAHCDPSYHLLYILLEDVETRDRLQRYLAQRGITTVFHYVPLHESPVGGRLHDGRPLPVTESVHGRLLRLPLYPDLADEDVDSVVASVVAFFDAKARLAANE